MHLLCVSHCAGHFDLSALWTPTNLCRAPHCAHYAEEEAKAQGAEWLFQDEARRTCWGRRRSHICPWPFLQPAMASKSLAAVPTSYDKGLDLTKTVKMEMTKFNVLQSQRSDPQPARLPGLTWAVSKAEETLDHAPWATSHWGRVASVTLSGKRQTALAPRHSSQFHVNSFIRVIHENQFL